MPGIVEKEDTATLLGNLAYSLGINTHKYPWPAWLRWLERHPVTKRLQVGYSVRAQTQVRGSIPG